MASGIFRIFVVVCFVGRKVITCLPLEHHARVLKTPPQCHRSPIVHRYESAALGIELPGGYWRWEAAKGWPSQAQINTLANIFECSVSDLVDEEQIETADAEATEAEFNDLVDRLQQMRPNATVTVTVTYGKAA